MQHIQWWSVFFANIFNFLQMWVDNFDQINLDFALSTNLFESAPNFLKKPNFVSRVNWVFKPVNQWLYELKNASLQYISSWNFNKPYLTLKILIFLLIQPLLSIEDIWQPGISHQKLGPGDGILATWISFINWVYQLILMIQISHVVREICHIWLLDPNRLFTSFLFFLAVVDWMNQVYPIYLELNYMVY